MRGKSKRLLTERDVAMLAWLARVRFATNDQITERFSLHRKKSYGRLGIMVSAGLVAHSRVLHHQPGVYHVTRKGLRTIGADFPVATVSMQSFLHDLAVVSQQIELELAERPVLSEREMRHEERVSDERYSVAVPATLNVGSSTHRPDLAVKLKGGWFAVEIELVAKSEARLRSILAAYLHASQYKGVLYMVPSAAQLPRIKRVGAELGLGSRLRVGVISTPEQAAA